MVHISYIACITCSFLNVPKTLLLHFASRFCQRFFDSSSSNVCSPFQFRLVVKTSLKLLLVFIEYNDNNALIVLAAMQAVDRQAGIHTSNQNAARNYEYTVVSLSLSFLSFSLSLSLSLSLSFSSVPKKKFFVFLHW